MESLFDLPPELLAIIVDKIDIQDINFVRLVSSYFYYLVQEFNKKEEYRPNPYKGDRYLDVSRPFTCFNSPSRIEFFFDNPSKEEKNLKDKSSLRDKRTFPTDRGDIIISFIHEASKRDDLDSIRVIKKNTPRSSMREYWIQISAVTISGTTPRILNYLHDEFDLRATKSELEYVIRVYDLECLLLFRKMINKNCDKAMLRLAAIYDRVDVLEYFHNEGTLFDILRGKICLTLALKNESIEVLKYLHQINRSAFREEIKDMMVNPSYYSMFRFLVDNGYESSLNRSLNIAIESENFGVESLAYLVSHGLPIARGHYMANAIHNRDLEAFAIILENGYRLFEHELQRFPKTFLRYILYNGVKIWTAADINSLYPQPMQGLLDGPTTYYRPGYFDETPEGPSCGIMSPSLD